MKPLRLGQIFLLIFWCASTAGWHHGTYNYRSGMGTSWQNHHSRVERLYQTPPNVDDITTSSSSSTTTTTNKPYPVVKHSFLAILIATSGLLFGQPQEGLAVGGWMANVSPTTLFTLASTLNKEVVVDPTATTTTPGPIFEPQQSPGWEAARMKRTAAMKELERKKIVRVDTDDAGNQFLELPWVPDRKVDYVNPFRSTDLYLDIVTMIYLE